MKKLHLILICLLVSSLLEAVPLIELMRKVNLEVDFQDDIPASWKDIEVYPENFNAAIQIHLLHVEEVLRSRQYDYMNTEQKSHRLQLLDVLHAYALEEKFPQNVHYRFQTPVFIDDFGTHCAVGYLMKRSGSADLAWQISQVNNLAYVREITVPGVAEWAQQWGFTVNELAWIQPGYPPNTTLTTLAGGIQGTVYSITEHDGYLMAAGYFDSAGTTPASNVAMYISGFAGWLWTEVGGGINGIVFKLINFEGDLIAAGEFTQAGSTPVNNIARYRNGTWEAMGTNVNGEVHDMLIFNNELYAFGLFQVGGTSGTSFNAAKWNGTSWVAAEFSPASGSLVLTAAADDQGIWIGGNFSSVSGVSCRNLAYWNGQTVEDRSTGIYGDIYDIEVVNNEVYSASSIRALGHTQGVMRYSNNEWSPITGVQEILQSDSLGSFKKLANYNNKLVAAGNLNVYANMLFGKGVAIWDTPDSYPEPLTVICDDLQEYVEEVYIGSSIYLGGSFNDNFNSELRGIAQLDGIVQDISKQNSPVKVFTAYPNPAEGSVTLSNYGNATYVEVLDLQGKLLMTHLIESGDVIKLPKTGNLILQTDTGSTFRILNK
ncbi:MAG: T9SS type A sorting domain-containing protein [Bacteroidia bacterium]